ncbi:hypothetical protein INS49_004319 [Diaporthe citri]|uniref:uncharacterized protein n=1 Tax=Diaporthe citri TaxID=83186 RepID=UPI001C7E6078|nr:uncharacterized protein INS49_004319 [Diaporthe citri]KAG6355238.1 hypothetical protein INS49_004319 [Diaporthe citri]
MATNSSNTTATGEVGWQAAPLTRGTASILWNCASVVLLVTWTNFHPPVGTTQRHRVFNTITAILVPELSALVAFRDFIFAFRLRKALRSEMESESWGTEWTLTKSFLVFKRGIRLRPHTHRAASDLSSSQCSNTTADDIVDPQTFLRLALVGSIRYEDFPISEEIDDKSKADWFAKSITLLQLLWAIVNIGCRRSYNYPASVLERLMFEWIIFGLLAFIPWWRCPQNIKKPYDVPFRDYAELMAMSHAHQNPPLSPVALHNKLMETPEDKDDEGRAFWISPFILAMASLCLAMLHALYFPKPDYQWHSIPAYKAWVFFTTSYYIAALALIYLDLLFWNFKSLEYLQGRYEKLLKLEAPGAYEQTTEPYSKWADVALGMGIYNVGELDSAETTVNMEWGEFNLLKVVVVTACVALFSQFARLVIALTAFSCAPRSIYDVFQTWILEALAHVGG